MSILGARRQNDHSIPTLYVNDQPINNPKDKSDALNNHFISVFTKEDLSKVPNIEDAEVTIPNIRISNHFHSIWNTASSFNS